MSSVGSGSLIGMEWSVQLVARLTRNCATYILKCSFSRSLSGKGRFHPLNDVIARRLSNMPLCSKYLARTSKTKSPIGELVGLGGL